MSDDTTPYTSVERLWEVGLPVGPAPNHDCASCSHNWGMHRLHADFHDPVEGGTWSCPEPDCSCFGTWSVTTQGQPCEAGRRLKRRSATWDSPCPNRGTHFVAITDEAMEPFALCKMHMRQFDALLNREQD